MPLATRHRTVLSSAAAVLAAAALCAAPAAAEQTPSAPGCPDVPTTRSFAPWQDDADYFLAPNGDFEAGTSGWALTGAADAVEGNAPFGVGQPGDHMSLRLPAHSSATTGPICIGVEHRSMRFFVRGSGSGVLHVDAVYAKRTAKVKSVRIASIAAADSWAPSPVVPMRVNKIAPAFANALPIALRFTTRGTGSWQIDDVSVDPYRMH